MSRWAHELARWSQSTRAPLQRALRRCFVPCLLPVALVGAQTQRPLPGIAVDALYLEAGRFTVVADRRDARLARALLASALSRDTFPGLPRPRAHVRIAVAPDAARFREWVGPDVPEWGAAIAVPAESQVVLQGGASGSDAGDPLVVLRHELAHLALHEWMGPLPPRWFDEGYASVAAGEWTRQVAFETSTGMVWRTLPTTAELNDGFQGGSSRAEWSYALAHRVVDELSLLDTQHGLTNLLAYWKESGALEPSIRRAFGMTGEQFEKHWRQQTRRRYGALALATDISAVLGFFALLIGPLYWMRRRRDRRRLDAMRAVDLAQERAFRESILDELLTPRVVGGSAGTSVSGAVPPE